MDTRHKGLTFMLHSDQINVHCLKKTFYDLCDANVGLSFTSYSSGKGSILGQCPRSISVVSPFFKPTVSITASSPEAFPLGDCGARLPGFINDNVSLISNKNVRAVEDMFNSLPFPFCARRPFKI